MSGECCFQFSSRQASTVSHYHASSTTVEAFLSDEDAKIKMLFTDRSDLPSDSIPFADQGMLSDETRTD
jgi:hypothetical protein